MVGLSERFQYVLDLDAQGAIRSLQRFGDTAEKELKGAENRLDKVGGRMQAAGLGAVAFAGVAGRAMFSLGQDAADLEQAVGGTEAVFGEWAATIEAAADTADTAMGLSERAFREATTSIGGNLKRMGLDVDDAADRSIELTQVAADLAATYGGTTAEAVQALGAAFRGEADPAERFNLNLKIGEVNARAVAMGLAESESSVSEYAKAQALMALIMEQSADAQGQFAREADTASGSMQIAAASAENMRASLGEAIAPVIADVSQKLAGMVGWLQDVNEQTGGGVGKVAAYGTAVIGVAGALSFVGGTAIKARDNLSRLTDSLHIGERGLGRAKTAVVGLGAAISALALAEMADEMRGIGVSAAELADQAGRATDAELVEGFRAWTDSLAGAIEVHEIVERQFRDLAETQHGTAQRMRDALVVAGEEQAVIALLDAELERAAGGSRQLATDQQATTETIEEGTDALGGQARALEDVEEQLEAVRKRNEETRESYEKLTSAVLAQFDADLRLADSMRSTDDAIQEHAAAVREHGADSREAAESLDEAAGAALEMAEAALEASGKVAGSAEGNQVLIDSLGQVASTLDPGSPLRMRLEEYIARLRAVPTTVDTTFNVRQNVHSQAIPGLPIPRFHSGGVYDAPAGQSEGLALLKDGEVVVNPDGSTSMRKGGGGVQMTVNIDMRGATPETMRQARVELPGLVERAAKAAVRAA